MSSVKDMRGSKHKTIIFINGISETPNTWLTRCHSEDYLVKRKEAFILPKPKFITLNGSRAEPLLENFGIFFYTSAEDAQDF